jgi:hypothetical protein
MKIRVFISFFTNNSILENHHLLVKLYIVMGSFLNNLSNDNN